MANNKHWTQKVYGCCPVFLQNILCSVKGYTIKKRRYSKHFFEELKKYETGYYKPEECLRNFLKEIKEVPFYKKLYREYHFAPDARDIYSEIKKLPVLDRETIVQNHDQILNTNFHGKTIILGSSGTTATSLVFPCSVERETKQWAVWWRYRRKLGIQLDTWCGWFGGQVVVPISTQKSPYWRINYPGRQVMFSAFHLSTHTVAEYYNEIRKRKLTWLHGHAHNITFLASLILEKKLPPIECVKYITTGADSLFNWQREIIREAFCKASIHQHYGLTEAVANISENREGILKVDEDFGYVEFLPLENAEPGLCKIIATGFNNQPFPFVRYDTGDLATVFYNEKGEVVIKQIDGRVVDSIKLPDGRRISSTSMTNFEFTTKVKEVQFYQKDVYNIVVRLVIREGYNEEEEQKVVACVRERLPEEVKIQIEYIDKVERTKSGKIRYIISDIK